MVLTEIMDQVETDGAMLVRHRKEDHQKQTPYHYDAKDLFTGSKRGWLMLDHTTVGAMRACYNALGEENKHKWDCIPLTRLVDFTWKHVQ